MRQYTSEQRKLYADQLCTLIRDWIGDETNDFGVEVLRGVEWRPNLATGDRHPRVNPTATLVLTINGGAQATEGKPMLSTPQLFRGPPNQAN